MELPKGYEDFLKTLSNFSGMFTGVEQKRKEIIRELFAVKGKSFPAKLYHYTGVAGIRGIIQSNHLWATDFRSLNDKTELIYGTSLLADELKKSGSKTDGNLSKLLNQASDFYREHGDDYRNFFETYIISLSEDPDMLSQWRAYSDNAKGCCLEFDFTDSRLFTIVGETTPWALEVLPVIYDEAAQKALVRSGIEKLLNHLSASVDNLSAVELGVILGFLIHTLEPFATAFKHPGFHEEKEWRAIASCQTTLTETIRKKRTSNSSTSNYLECVFIQDDEERMWQRKLLPITSIKYGPLAEDAIKAEIKGHLLNNGYENQVVHSDSSIPLKN